MFAPFPHHRPSPRISILNCRGREFFPAFVKIKKFNKTSTCAYFIYILYVYADPEEAQTPSRKFKLITSNWILITENRSRPPPFLRQTQYSGSAQIIYSVRDVHKRLISRHADTFKTFIATTFSHKYAHWFIAHSS